MTRRGSHGQLVDPSTSILQQTLPSGAMTSLRQVTRRGSQGQLVDSSPKTHHYTVHSKRMFHGRKKDAWWQVAILCLPCLLVLLFFGILPAMKRRTRIICSIVSVAVISVIVGTVLVTTNYSPYSFKATTGDQRPLYSKYSTYFCSNFDVVSQQDEVSVYFFKELPPMKHERIENYSVAGGSKIGPNEYEVLQFYLLEGSEIEAKLEVRNHRYDIREEGPLYDVYLIQGDRNFAAWKSNRHDHRSYQMKLTNKTELVYNVTESDVYYFIVADESILSSIDVTVSLLLKKTLYDLNNRLRKCFSANGNICSFYLDLGSNEIAILDIDYEFGGDTKGYDITTACRANQTMYVLAFLVSPFIFLVIWSAMLWVCFKPKKKEQPAMRPPELGRDVRPSISESRYGQTGRRGSRDSEFDIGLFRMPFDVPYLDRIASVENGPYAFEEVGPIELSVVKLPILSNVSPTDGRGSRGLDVGSFCSLLDSRIHEEAASAEGDADTFEQDGLSELSEVRLSSVSGVSNPLYNCTMYGENESAFEPLAANDPLELNAGRLTSINGFCNPLTDYTTAQVDDEASPEFVREQGSLELSIRRLPSLCDLPNQCNGCTMLDDREAPSVHEEFDLPVIGPSNRHHRPVERLPLTHHIPSRDRSSQIDNEEEENQIFWV